MAGKEKQEGNNKLKQLYFHFQKQRKALEVSIKKNKRYEFEQSSQAMHVQEKDKNILQMTLKIEHLEQSKDLLQQKHRQEVEQLNREISERQSAQARLGSDLDNAADQREALKHRIDEYEVKIKD